MLDFLKENTEAWIDRVKSPIFGSIGLAFVLFNWKPLWYLVFSEQAVAVKFRFFDLNTTIWSLYFYPLFAGLLFAYFSPWIHFIGSRLAADPIRRRRFLQLEEASKQRISQIDSQILEEQKRRVLEAEKAEKEKARDNRAIDAAMRLRSAEDVGGSEVVEKILTSRENASVDEEPQQNAERFELMERDTIVLRIMANEGVRFRVDDIPQDISFQLKQGFKSIFPIVNDARVRAEMETSLRKLESQNLAQVDRNGIWSLTSVGFSMADKFNSL